MSATFRLLRSALPAMPSESNKPRLPPFPAILAVFVLPLAGAYAMYKWSEPTRVEKQQMEAEILRQQREGKLPLKDDDTDD